MSDSNLRDPPSPARKPARKNPALSVSFGDGADFGAMYAAERWCAERGLSVGRNQRGAPRGLLYGDYDIQKWRNLRAHERTELDGLMVGDMRCGPVTVSLYRILAKAGV